MLNNVFNSLHFRRSRQDKQDGLGSHDGQYVWAGHNMRYSNFDHNDEEGTDASQWSMVNGDGQWQGIT